jgi:hypothetical protein
MRRARMIVGGIAALAASLVVGVAAVAAATPNQIYRDYADNARLDGTYTRAELQAALGDTTVQGYGKPGFQTTVTKKLGRSSSPGATSPGTATAGEALTQTGRAGTLPFTGLDLALLLGVGLVLLAVGAGMRRAGRSRT